LFPTFSHFSEFPNAAEIVFAGELPAGRLVFGWADARNRVVAVVCGVVFCDESKLMTWAREDA
jgi:hypothetical protein